jgi:hypothetical protein
VGQNAAPPFRWSSPDSIFVHSTGAGSGSSHGPYTEKGEYKISIGVISDLLVQTVLFDIHIIGPLNRSVSLWKMGIGRSDLYLVV